MNIEQIRKAAEAESFYLNDDSYTRILVASLSADTNAATLLHSFRDAVEESGLRAKVVRTGSFGYYDFEPIVVIETPDSSAVIHHNVAPDDVVHLINNCLTKNIYNRDRDLCRIGNKKISGIPHISELPLFKLQSRIALRNCGWIDPENINHYIVRGHGYTGLSRALKMKKEDLLNPLTESALRDRNEIGNSTAGAWNRCCESGEEEKYLICNAIDTDPQARTARLLLESDPHSVLEGMLIGAFAVSASRCFIFAGEGSDSLRRIAKALEQMRECNLVGTNILDSHFTSEIEIMEVPSSCAAGYETELLRCIEDRQPAPRMHPAFPAPGEFSLKPAVITSPEIMSNLSADPAGRSDKAAKSKVVTLSGSVVHKYTIEIDLKTTVRSVVNELGGGVSSGKAIKAAKLGGPAGVFVAAGQLDNSLGCVVDEESKTDFCLGSIEVFDSDTSIVDAAKEIVFNIQAQSCGRCSFCREGSLQMLTILEEIAENKGRPGDLELLTELGTAMKTACLCAFGRAAPDPVLSSIKLFQSEYDERIKRSPFRVQG